MVLLALVLSLGAFPRGVLCVGTNGHFAIEPAAAGCCHSTSTDENVIGHDEGRCAPECTDTPVGFSLASRAPDRSDLAPLPGVASVGPLFEPPGAWFHAVSLYQLNLRAIVPPRSLRTTVNLC